MPRKPRIDAPGLLYHVMARGIDRGAIYTDDHDRDFFLKRLGEILTETKTTLHAFALLPSHFHLLILRNRTPLSTVMSRLLTGYAVYFNQRHKRVGHLFQNRYKAIICQEDRYFRELVRYIHLNPLRAGQVKTLEELDKYPYSGHGHLRGNRQLRWFKPDQVLAGFGETPEKANSIYHDFIAAGLQMDHAVDFDGGGLNRSLAGAAASKRLKQQFDDRVLGDGIFVEKLIGMDSEIQCAGKKPDVGALVSSVCDEYGISITELLGGARRKRVVEAREFLVMKMATDAGLSLSSIARELSLSRTAVSRIMRRRPIRVSLQS